MKKIKIMGWIFIWIISFFVGRRIGNCLSSTSSKQTSTHTNKEWKCTKIDVSGYKKNSLVYQYFGKNSCVCNTATAGIMIECDRVKKFLKDEKNGNI